MWQSEREKNVPIIHVTFVYSWLEILIQRRVIS